MAKKKIVEEVETNQPELCANCENSGLRCSVCQTGK